MVKKYFVPYLLSCHEALNNVYLLKQKTLIQNELNSEYISLKIKEGLKCENQIQSY